MCLAQGPHAVTPVRLEPAALQSRVKHSITEPLRSLLLVLLFVQEIFKNKSSENDQSTDHFRAFLLSFFFFVLPTLNLKKKIL